MLVIYIGGKYTAADLMVQKLLNTRCIHDGTVFTLFLFYFDMAHTGVGQPLFTVSVFVCVGGITMKTNNGSCNRLFIDLKFPKHLWWVLSKNINLTL